MIVQIEGCVEPEPGCQPPQDNDNYTFVPSIAENMIEVPSQLSMKFDDKLAMGTGIDF